MICPDVTSSTAVSHRKANVFQTTAPIASLQNNGTQGFPNVVMGTVNVKHNIAVTDLSCDDE